MTVTPHGTSEVPTLAVATSLQWAPEVIGTPDGVHLEDPRSPGLPPRDSRQTGLPGRSRWAVVGLVGLRLALGFEFLWAFLDKLFGLGYSTPRARAWIHGGSPTSGFLAGANVGPFQGIFRSLSGVPGMDWLFMIGLLGIGAAFLLGVALRPAAFCGALMLLLMWAAVWVPAKTAGGQPSGSTNPLVDEHIVGIFGFIAVGALASWGAGPLGRTWSSLTVVRDHPWLR